MSWDVLLYSANGTPTSLAALEADKELDLPIMGTAAELRSRITGVVPGVDWSDPSWGIFDGLGYSIEFNVGQDDSIKDVMLHVRGGGDAISPIVAIRKANAWRALDTVTGECLDLDAPSDRGWVAFQEYRDKVVGRTEK